MFGIGFSELLIIFIVAILFLGPDKLPEALIDIAKFIKSIKKTISDAKHSFEEEVKLADLKEEALTYKKQLDDATAELKSFKNISLDDLEDEVFDEEISEVSPMEHVKATQNSAQRSNTETVSKHHSDEQKSTDNSIETKNTTVTFKKKKSDQNQNKEKIQTEQKDKE